jgi:hypothetical protein
MEKITKKSVVAPMLKHHTIKMGKWVEVKLHTFLTSALDRDMKSASRSGHFTLKERMGKPKCCSGSDTEEKSLCSWRKSNPGRPARTTLPWFPDITSPFS